MLLARPLPIGKGLYLYKKPLPDSVKVFLFGKFRWGKSMENSEHLFEAIVKETDKPKMCLNYTGSIVI